MRKLIIIAVISALFIECFPDPFFSLDKADHFMTALVMTVASSMAVKNIADADESETKIIVMSAALPLFFSFAKEAYDGLSKSGTVSYKDLIYDFAGIIVGLIIVR